MKQILKPIDLGLKLMVFVLFLFDFVVETIFELVFFSLELFSDKLVSVDLVVVLVDRVGVSSLFDFIDQDFVLLFLLFQFFFDFAYLLMLKLLGHFPKLFVLFVFLFSDLSLLRFV